MSKPYENEYATVLQFHEAHTGRIATQCLPLPPCNYSVEESEGTWFVTSKTDGELVYVGLGLVAFWQNLPPFRGGSTDESAIT